MYLVVLHYCVQELVPLNRQFNSSLEYMPDLPHRLWQGCVLGWLCAVVSAQVYQVLCFGSKVHGVSEWEYERYSDV